MAKIFISYRRDDSQYQADKLHGALKPYVANPKTDVFIDIDNIPLGVDFAQFLAGKVAECDVLLALIGHGWTAACNPKTGARRLDEAGDFVRIEIAAALARGIPVVPVLLDGAPVPEAGELPEDLKPLARRNCLPVTRASFDADIERLVKGLPIDLPGKARPNPPPPRAPATPGKDPGNWYWAIGAAAAALVAFVAWQLGGLNDEPPKNLLAEPAATDVTGAQSAETKAEVLEGKSEPTVLPAADPVAVAARREAIRNLQSLLARLGHYIGPIDGVAGVGTQLAVEEFARSQGVAAPIISTSELSEFDAITKLARIAVRNREIEEDTFDWSSIAADPVDPGPLNYDNGLTAYNQKDFAAAKLHWEQSCSAGYMAACNGLGLLYEGGAGVVPDQLAAKRFYQMACDGGNQFGCENLKNLN